MISVNIVEASFSMRSVCHTSACALLQSTTTWALCYMAGCRGEGGGAQTRGRTVCSKEQLLVEIRSSASPTFMLCADDYLNVYLWESNHILQHQFMKSKQAKLVDYMV
mgnify:CR=1 FL=1